MGETHAVVVGFGPSAPNADVCKFARGLLLFAFLPLKIPTDLIFVEAIVMRFPTGSFMIHETLFAEQLDALPDGAEEEAALPFPFPFVLVAQG